MFERDCELSLFVVVLVCSALVDPAPKADNLLHAGVAITLVSAVERRPVSVSVLTFQFTISALPQRVDGSDAEQVGKVTGT